MDEIEKNMGVSVNGLTVRYGEKTVLDNLTMSFSGGKISVILGGSGVGKTTLLNAVAGLIEPTSGKVSGAEDGVSFIFQKDRLIPSISVYKNLDLILKSFLKDRKARAERIDEMLALLEISDQKNKLPNELSGGQAQRVALARAFLYPKNVLLMDEPFRALDTALKTRLLSALVALNEREKRTVVFVTHAIDECLLAADDWYVLGGAPATVTASGGISLPQKDRRLSDESLDEVRKMLLAALYS